MCNTLCIWMLVCATHCVYLHITHTECRLTMDVMWTYRPQWIMSRNENKLQMTRKDWWISPSQWMMWCKGIYELYELHMPITYNPWYLHKIHNNYITRDEWCLTMNICIPLTKSDGYHSYWIMWCMSIYELYIHITHIFYVYIYTRAHSPTNVAHFFSDEHNVTHWHPLTLSRPHTSGLRRSVWGRECQEGAGCIVRIGRTGHRSCRPRPWGAALYTSLSISSINSVYWMWMHWYQICESCIFKIGHGNVE